jgi:hypothetical protein
MWSGKRNHQTLGCHYRNAVLPLSMPYKRSYRTTYTSSCSSPLARNTVIHTPYSPMLRCHRTCQKVRQAAASAVLGSTAPPRPPLPGTLGHHHRCPSKTAACLPHTLNHSNEDKGYSCQSDQHQHINMYLHMYEWSGRLDTTQASPERRTICTRRQQHEENMHAHVCPPTLKLAENMNL